MCIACLQKKNKKKWTWKSEKWGIKRKIKPKIQGEDKKKKIGTEVPYLQFPVEYAKFTERICTTQKI